MTKEEAKNIIKNILARALNTELGVYTGKDHIIFKFKQLNEAIETLFPKEEK